MIVCVCKMLIIMKLAFYLPPLIMLLIGLCLISFFYKFFQSWQQLFWDNFLWLVVVRFLWLEVLMEAVLLWWRSLDDVHPWVGLTHSFVSNSGDNFYFHCWDKLVKCNYMYSNLHSFVANSPCNYCIELWLTLGVSIMKLLWKFLMLVLEMSCLDWMVKKEKSTSTFGTYFSCFGPLLGLGCDRLHHKNKSWRVTPWV